MSARLLLLVPVVVTCAALGCATGPHQLQARGKPLVPNPHFANAVGEYGYSETNPILVASLGGRSHVENEHLFLSRLRGPAGQRVDYRRLGNCCQFPSPNGLFGDMGLLDEYEIGYEGIAHPISLYLNMYDPGDARAPLGFSLVE